MTVIFEREGIQLIETRSHTEVHGAICECGERLFVAPSIYHADHKKGDPVVVCHDMGAHAYRWLELVPGRQPRGSSDRGEPTGPVDVVVTPNTDHSKCSASTDISGGTSCGQGELSDYGLWEHHCWECTAKSANRWALHLEEEVQRLKDELAALRKGPQT